MTLSERLPKGGPIEQQEIDPEQVDWERELERWAWTFARTMAHIPHWYVVGGKTISAREFEAFADYIKTHGYRAIWTSPGGRRYENIYLEIGEWKYWRIDVVINLDLLGSSTVEKID